MFHARRSLISSVSVLSRKSRSLIKASQAVDREIVLSLSYTVAQIAGFIKQLQLQELRKLFK